MPSSTTFDNTIDAILGHILVTASLPSAPTGYYGTRIKSDEWQGGEIIYNSADSRLYVQTATSGKTATWKRVVTQFTAAE